jgi:hypothetical protein
MDDGPDGKKMRWLLYVKYPWDVLSAASLEFYWKGGQKNMQWATAAYDMMHEEGAVEMATDISTTNLGDKNTVDSIVFS